MNKSKSLQDLNLVDSFLFSASTENPQNAELIAKLIIERATGRRIKEVSVMPEYVSIWILTEDPFGANRMLYTVRNKVEKLEKIHKIVTSIKENVERRNRYMTFKEMIQFEKEESYDEGYDEGVAFGETRGIEQGINTVIIIHISSLREFNIQEEQILDNVMQKFSVSKERAMELMAEGNC